MVEVRLRKDSRNRLSSFFATGHAGWADSGEDIVCAAVSTLLQAAWLGLTEVAGFEVDGAKRAGQLELHWPETARDDPAAAAIVATAARSIERLALQFPEHVRAVSEPEP
jgi:uncharacterized protein YsxB (DUF464 family)